MYRNVRLNSLDKSLTKTLRPVKVNSRNLERLDSHIYVLIVDNIFNMFGNRTFSSIILKLQVLVNKYYRKVFS